MQRACSSTRRADDSWDGRVLQVHGPCDDCALDRSLRGSRQRHDAAAAAAFEQSGAKEAAAAMARDALVLPFVDPPQPLETVVNRGGAVDHRASVAWVHFVLPARHARCLGGRNPMGRAHLTSQMLDGYVPFVISEEAIDAAAHGAQAFGTEPMTAANELKVVRALRERRLGGSLSFVGSADEVLAPVALHRAICSRVTTVPRLCAGGAAHLQRDDQGGARGGGCGDEERAARLRALNGAFTILWHPPTHDLPPWQVCSLHSHHRPPCRSL